MYQNAHQLAMTLIHDGKYGLQTSSPQVNSAQGKPDPGPNHKIQP